LYEAVAASETVLLRLSVERFLDVLDDNRELALEFLRALASLALELFAAEARQSERA